MSTKLERHKSVRVGYVNVLDSLERSFDVENVELGAPFQLVMLTVLC